jgi:hypothetical protein
LKKKKRSISTMDTGIGVGGGGGGIGDNASESSGRRAVSLRGETGTGVTLRERERENREKEKEREKDKDKEEGGKRRNKFLAFPIIGKRTGECAFLSSSSSSSSSSSVSSSSASSPPLPLLCSSFYLSPHSRHVVYTFLPFFAHYSLSQLTRSVLLTVVLLVGDHVHLHLDLLLFLQVGQLLELLHQNL